MREGLLLDQVIGGVLDAARELTDAEAVALLPSGGAPALTCTAKRPAAGGAEPLLLNRLEETLAQGRPSQGEERGLQFVSLPVRVADQLAGAFGVVRKTNSDPSAQMDVSVRLFAQILSHALERDRTFGTLIRRRDEAVALSRSPQESAAPAEIPGSWIGPMQEMLLEETTLSGLLEKGAEAVRNGLDLDLCAMRLSLPRGSAPAAAVSLRSGTAPSAAEGIPDALLEDLSLPGSSRLHQDVLADPIGPTLLPVPGSVRNLQRPLGMAAVPIVFRESVLGVLAGVSGGKPSTFSPATLETLRRAARVLGAALGAATEAQTKAGNEPAFDATRNLARVLASSPDAAFARSTFCEGALALIKADGAQLFEPEAQGKSLRLSAWSGRAPGREVERSLPPDRPHPVVRAAATGKLVTAEITELVQIEPAASEPSGSSLARAAAVPLVHRSELVGVLMVASRHGSVEWPSGWSEALSLLGDLGAIALQGSRFGAQLNTPRDRDSQTGILNRAAILKRLETELRRAERAGRSLAVAHGRFDHLNEAIEKFGREASATFLPKAISQVLQATRTANVVGRDRSDRFFILIFDADKAQAQHAVEALQKEFDGLVDPRLDAAKLRITLTFGIAAYPEDAFDTASLVLRAEEALDDAVKEGPGSIVFYGALSGF